MAYLLKNLNNRVLNLQPYNYTTHKPDYYTFTSSIGCEYDCYFYDFSSAFYLYPDLAPRVFGFNLDCDNRLGLVQVGRNGFDDPGMLALRNAHRESPTPVRF